MSSETRLQMKPMCGTSFLHTLLLLGMEGGSSVKIVKPANRYPQLHHLNNK